MKRLSTIVICIALTVLARPVVQPNRPLVAQDRPRVIAPDAETPLDFTLTATLAGHKEQVSELAFSPNGDVLATASARENATRLWTTTTGELIAVLDGIAPLFSPDGHALLTVNQKTPKLWDAANGRLKLTLTGHEADITSTCFSAGGSKLATGSEDGTVRLWDLNTGQTTATITVWRVKKLPRYRIISRALRVPVDVYVRFSPDQQTILTNTYWEDSSAKLWSANTGRLQAELGGHTTEVGFSTRAAGVTRAIFSPNGKFIATQSIDQVKLWDAVTGKLIRNFGGIFREINFSADSKWLACVRVDKEIGWVNPETLNFQPMIGFDPSFFNQQAFSPDGQTYVAGSGLKKYYATLIDVSTGHARTKIPLVAKWGFDFVSDYQKDVDILSFHPNSKWLLGANHHSVRLWDVSTGALAWETTLARDPVGFSRGGQWLATTGQDKKTVLVWATRRTVAVRQ